jgi:hypothetical protein
MPGHTLRGLTRMVVAAAICAAASIAHGQIYKCTDPAGKTTYSDAPCDSASKPVKLPDEPKASPAGPHVCAQLQDETRRLAAEADRDAKRGRAESADSAKRRLALTKRYEERCAGIARSEPKPN